MLNLLWYLYKQPFKSVRYKIQFMAFQLSWKLITQYNFGCQSDDKSFL